MGYSTELPRYQSHKKVRALKIAAIEIHENGAATIAPKDEGVAPIKTKSLYGGRFQGNENDLGYYVRYENGYETWSPTEAFENGYTLIDDGCNGEDVSVTLSCKRTSLCHQAGAHESCHHSDGSRCERFEGDDPSPEQLKAKYDELDDLLTELLEYHADIAGLLRAFREPGLDGWDPEVVEKYLDDLIDRIGRLVK